jgi:formylmethanofuran dehydrogenase subunit C
MGNIVEVESDVDEYRKFRSITDILSNGLKNDKPIDFQLEGNKLFIDDGTVKDTVGARLDKEVEVVLNGDVDLSTGILMRKGTVKIDGNAGKNSGALLNGGKLVINGDTDDFTGIDMIKGLIIINGNAGKFMGANKKNGTILAIEGNPIPPTSLNQVETSDLQQLINLGFNPGKFKKFQ